MAKEGLTIAYLPDSSISFISNPIVSNPSPVVTLSAINFAEKCQHCQFPLEPNAFGVWKGVKMHTFCYIDLKIQELEQLKIIVQEMQQELRKSRT